MITTSEQEYSTVNLNGEQLILIPGCRFSKMELKSRLKEMDFKDNNIQDKENLSKLYDSSLNNYQNCLKIIQRLRKDTNNMNTKLAISQRQSMPSNIKTSNNLAQIKMMNISYDVKNLYGNSREQQINIVKPIHTNKGKYVQNPFISSINSQNFNTSYNNDINNKNSRSGYNNINSFNSNNMNNSNNMIMSNRMNGNNKEENIKSNNNNYINNTYNYNNLEKSNISDINKINNNSSFLSDNNNLFKYRNSHPYEDMNNEVQNSLENNNKSNNNNFNNIQYNPPYEEQKIDIDENKKNDIPNNSYNNNIQNTQEIQDYNNLPRNESLDKTPMGNNYKKPSKRLSYQPNYLKNDIYSNDVNNKKSRNTLTNLPRSKNINEMPYNSIIQNNKSNSQNYINSSNKEEENVSPSKSDIKKDPDAVSTFSFFSALGNFPKYPFYKNKILILLHLILLLGILCLSIYICTGIRNSWDSISSFFSNIFGFLSNPSDIINTISSYISPIIIPFNYWYITFPVIVLLFLFYFFMRKYMFNKRCNEIYERIVKDLQENENDNRGISEEDICRKYSEMYGISYNKFVRKYLQKIQKIRREDKENRLKLSSVKNNEKEYIFWELNE